MSTAAGPIVYVVVLNWNGWQDTLACLEALHRLDGPEHRIVVCDNGSTDGSMAALSRWLEAGGAGTLQVRRSELAAGRVDTTALAAASRILVDNEANLGYAGGNNTALRMLLEHCEFDYAWILNNDTLPRPNALRALLDRMGGSPQLGLCGSALHHVDRPQVVQSLGGRLIRSLAIVRNVGAGAAPDDEVVDYPVGASLLLSRRLLSEVGLLSESYFLYFEELDLVERARGKFGIAVACDSVVLHHHGASVERHDGDRAGSTADYYFQRGRILYTRKFCAHWLATVALAVMASAVLRLLRGKPRRAWTVVQALRDGLMRRTGARPSPRGSPS